MPANLIDSGRTNPRDPFIVGWIKDATGSFEAGLYFLAASALLSGIIAYLAVQPTGQTSAPSGLAAAAR